MTRRSVQIAQLGSLTDMVFVSEKAALSRLVSREAKLIQQSKDLYDAKRQPLEGETLVPVAVDLRWRKWIDHRLELMNRELAQIRVLKSEQQEKLLMAFAKNSAVAGIAKKL